MRAIGERVRTGKKRLDLEIKQRQGRRYVASHAPLTWFPFSELADTSWSLVCLRPEPAARTHVSLLLPALGPDALYAGVRTALATAAQVALIRDLPIRVISYGSIPTASDKSWLTRFLAEEFGYSRAPVELLSGWSLRDMEVSTREIWIGTYWTTAHALQVAANLGVVRADQVLYLVQDYEPDFFPGSTESALAQSTYHAGFKCIINSTPVQRALRTHEGIDVPDHLVFRPELDLGRLRRTSDRRPQRAPRRVGFYGRPSKPRNSFALGIAALRHTAGLAESAGIDLQFVSMGEPHAPIRLAEDAELSAVGKLSWESYFDALSEIPVLLSLQQSPHPSHPPLEAVASGGFAVTNDVDQTRFGLSSRLRAVRNDPIELGEAIFEAVIDTSAYVNDGVDMGFMQGLGGEFSESIAAAAGELGLS